MTGRDSLVEESPDARWNVAAFRLSREAGEDRGVHPSSSQAFVLLLYFSSRLVVLLPLFSSLNFFKRRKTSLGLGGGGSHSMGLREWKPT